jgi:hypothetical protein
MRAKSIPTGWSPELIAGKILQIARSAPVVNAGKRIPDREQAVMFSVILMLVWRRGTMPLLLLWAVPAVIVVGGAGYWLVHMH